MHNSSTTKTMKQITNNIMMIEPVLFNYNTETALDNHYQKNNTDLTQNEIQQKALKEFNDFVSLLRSKKLMFMSLKTLKVLKHQILFFQIIGFHFTIQEKYFYFQCLQKIDGLKEDMI